MKDIVDKYCTQFKGRYLSVKTIKKLTDRQRMFHFDGHWNILQLDESGIKHSYRCGGTGDIGETYSSTTFAEINKIVFVKMNETFILFKRSNGRLNPIYTSLDLRMLESVNAKHRFFFENGFEVKRCVTRFCPHTLKISYDKVDVFKRKD